MTQLLVFSAVLALLTWWLERRLIRRTEIPQPWSTVATAGLVVLWLFAVIGIGSGTVFDPAWARAPAFVGWAWVGVGYYISLGLLIIGIISLLDRLIRRLLPHAHSDADPPGRLRMLRGATAVVVAAALGVSAFGLVAAARPQVVNADVPLAQLPAEFEGLRVALVSDLHVGPSRGRAFTQRVVDLVNADSPDLVLIAGDLVDGTVALVGPDLTPLAQLSAPLGVFGVSGNHEFYADDGGRWLDVWGDLGIRTLRNERVTISRGGEQIQLAGIHDYSSPSPYEPDLPAALDGGDPDGFTLLLAHQPRQAPEASDLGVNLQLSGHTHGGQLWPFGYLVRLQQPQVEGLGMVGGTAVYTTRGAGAWGPPMRVGAAPEVTIVTLTQAS